MITPRIHPITDFLASFSSLALELRGYGTNEQIKIPQAYPLKQIDYFALFLIVIVNLAGFFLVRCET